MGFDTWVCETAEDILTAILFEGVDRVTAKERARADELCTRLDELIGCGSLRAELKGARLDQQIAVIEGAARLGAFIDPSLSDRALNGESLEDLLTEVLERAGHDGGLEL